MMSWEEHLSTQQLGHDTTNRPHINSCGELDRLEETFWGPIADLGMAKSFSWCWLTTVDSFKARDLEVTVGVNEKIVRSQISMNDLC